MIITVLGLTLAATNLAEGFDERVVRRCERSAWPKECLEAGQAAMHSARLVQTYRRGLDQNRFQEGERGRGGVPIPARVEAHCGVAQKACVMNVTLFYDRRRSGYDAAALTDQEIAMRAAQECSLENHSIID